MLIKGDIQQLLGSSTYQSYLQQKPNPLNPRYKKLTDEEFVAIYAYTRETGKYTYVELNKQFRKLSIAHDFFVLYTKIKSGLQSIDRDLAPPIFYRGITLTPAELIDVYKQDFVSIHTFLTSVSGVPKGHLPGNVFLRIFRSQANKPPAYIGGISAYPNEEEYLYDQNTLFLVIAVVHMGSGNYEVQLAEVDQ